MGKIRFDLCKSSLLQDPDYFMATLSSFLLILGEMLKCYILLLF